MTFRQNIHPTDWSGIELVDFDVDGTLYDQRALRIRMASYMVFQAFLGQGFSVLSVIRTYRRIRKRLGEEVFNFEMILIAQVAASTGYSEENVLAIVTRKEVSFSILSNKLLSFHLYFSTLSLIVLAENIVGSKPQNQLLTLELINAD